ncbi:MAG: tRNA (N6-isopentenyl adenosine(37)-C2)-methylthiotransferase MiaB [Pseudomonadota bacterium]
MTAPKKLFVKTYGCQMNVYDSERMSEAMATAGYQATDTAEDADMILLNTCHIREKAAEKVYSELGRIRKLADAKKAAGGEMLVGVAGCVAQAEGEEIVRRQPLVDLVVGPQAYHRLPDMAARAQAEGRAVIDTEFPEDDKFAAPRLRGPKAMRAPAAFLTVQEGCDKFCAFCVVPYTRGAEISRPAAQVLAEARDLVERGVVEITLLGQNVNAWRGEAEGGRWGLGRLIRELAEIEGLARIRFTTSHPNDMDEDLIAAHGDVDKLMPYLHLPVQSGADRVLHAMNRRHTAEAYLRLVERIRAVRPDLALSGDFIVGFPGETEAEFEETMALVRAVEYAQAYSFKYSARPGTPAADLPLVDPDEASDRLYRLQALLGEQQAAFQESCVGRTLPVLIEKPGRMPGQMVGRSPYLQAVHMLADETRVGEIVDARIIAAKPNSLEGFLT